MTGRRAMRERTRGTPTASPVTPRTVPAMPHRDALKLLRITAVGRKGKGARENAKVLAEAREQMREIELFRPCAEAAVRRRLRIG